MRTDPNRSANVLWVAESNFASKSGIKAHTHDYYHLFFVRQGPVDFLIGDRIYTIGDGEFMLARPGVFHGMEPVQIRMARCYEIKFTVSSHRLETILTFLPPILPESSFTSTLIQELVEESVRAEAASPDIAADYLLTLINYLYRKYGAQQQDIPSKAGGVIDVTGYPASAKAVVHYLEQHYGREIPLQELADAVGLNKNYLCSAFKRDSGMTIGNCLMLIRIRKAAELISFSDMNLSQVAAATGFSNLSHFNRIFKKVVGIPPGQYRRMFPADILLPGDTTQVPEFSEQNGFVFSVLGGKKLSVEDIILQEGLSGPETSSDFNN